MPPVTDVPAPVNSANATVNNLAIKCIANVIHKSYNQNTHNNNTKKKDTYEYENTK